LLGIGVKSPVPSKPRAGKKQLAGEVVRLALEVREVIFFAEVARFGCNAQIPT
jgi:hypothetical protein